MNLKKMRLIVDDINRVANALEDIICDLEYLEEYPDDPDFSTPQQYNRDFNVILGALYDNVSTWIER
jgi:hypothetical protein